MNVKQEIRRQQAESKAEKIQAYAKAKAAEAKEQTADALANGLNSGDRMTDDMSARVDRLSERGGDKARKHWFDLKGRVRNAMDALRGR